MPVGSPFGVAYSLNQMLSIRKQLFAVLSCLLSLGDSAHAQGDGPATVAVKEYVRAHSPSLTSRRLALAVAEARRNATGLASPVMLNAEVEEVPQFANLVNANSVRVDASRELPRRGFVSASRRLAAVDISRAQAELQLQERLLDAEVDRLLATAAGNTSIASRLAQEDSLLSRAEEALRSRFAVGDARFVDVLRLRTERLRVETDIAKARGRSRVGRRQLILMSLNPDSVDTRRLADEAIREAARTMLASAPPAPSVDSLVAASLAVVLSRIEVERAGAARQLLLSEQRGTLTPMVGLQRFTGDNGKASLGITAGISLPLTFTSQRANSLRVLVSDRELSLAQAELLATTNSVRRNIIGALDRFETARTQIAAFDNALLRGARDEREAALASYQTGSLSLVELLDFERALAQAEVSRIESRIEVADALLDVFEAALGAERLNSDSHNGDKR